MSISTTLSDLYRRDLTRLLQELEAFPDTSSLWRPLPGISNSAGNLILHLEGNLRECSCRCIGAIPYQRRRDAEFSTTGLTAAELRPRVQQLIDQVPATIAALTPESLDAIQPEPLGNRQMPTLQ